MSRFDKKVKHRFDISISSEETAVYKRFALTVISFAVEDARGRGSLLTKEDAKFWREQARWWLTEDKTTFPIICEIAGLDSKKVQAYFKSKFGSVTEPKCLKDCVCQEEEEVIRKKNVQKAMEVLGSNWTPENYVGI